MRGEEGTRAPATTPPTNDPMDAIVEPSIEPTPEEPQVSIPSPVSPPTEGLVTPITEEEDDGSMESLQSCRR
ncbi:hypothetical protein L6452_41801 [Arctium lappa]|uniref:Uncharacterized protein n=1 Tax=Arctium lappa TaxID=4217 RepID=A0ACB8XH69_ARCLA|nr:hypothetical protein L6452_41801 [Arctium lappa]